MYTSDEQPQIQRKILILDDERLVRFTISAYLKSAGYTVTAAATPEEAMGYIKREAFHAIVSDVMMGEVDGFMFRDMLRKFDPDVPVLFLTSMMNDGGNTFLERLMEDLHSYFVSKSAPRAVLVARLDQIVKAHTAELNVRMMQSRLTKSLALASLVQKAMLPTWTHLCAHYAYAVCWEPLSEVSGDLFEWYPLGDSAALFVIGDISGHGTNAALAMTAIQAFLKQYAYIEDKKARQVNKVATQIHDFFKGNLGDIAYMATTVLYLNTNEKILRYINCGNPEPLCIDRKTGEQRDMNPNNLGAIPPGMFADAEYREEDIVEFKINKDDIILIYSDGIQDISLDDHGSDTPPAEVLREICSMAATNTPDNSTLLCDLPYSIMQSLEALGYTHKQDDMSLFALGEVTLPESTYATEVRMQPHPIDDACREASAWVTEHTGDAELGVKIDLLLNEHLMNIYRHGFNDFGRQHEVAILTLDLKPQMLTIGVWDRGAPWKTIASASDGEAEAKLDEQNASLSGGGRGRPILKKIAESISSERFMNLNRTMFHVRLSLDGDSSTSTN